MLVEIDLLRVGHCTHPERMVLPKGYNFKPLVFPSICALMKHEKQGYSLFDTGYSPFFFSASEKFPLSIYQKVTPVSLLPSEDILSQLQQRDIGADQVSTIFISHFHGDHVAGLKYFENSKFVYFDQAWSTIKNKRRFAALLAGFLPALIPDDFETRSHSLTLEQLRQVSYSPFNLGVDYFGDGSVIAIPLPGHQKGQLGLLVRSSNRGDLLLCADACWARENYLQQHYPSKLARLVTADWQAYLKTIDDLALFHQRYPEISIIPSHCEKSYESFHQIS